MATLNTSDPLVFCWLAGTTPLRTPRGFRRTLLIVLDLLFYALALYGLMRALNP